MAHGTVKWFSPAKGCGFIQPQGRGKDAFMHIFAVERAGLSALKEGQEIKYEIVEDRGKICAVKITSRAQLRVSGDRCGDAVGLAPFCAERRM